MAPAWLLLQAAEAAASRDSGCAHPDELGKIPCFHFLYASSPFTADAALPPNISRLFQIYNPPCSALPIGCPLAALSQPSRGRILAPAFALHHGLAAQGTTVAAWGHPRYTPEAAALFLAFIRRNKEEMISEQSVRGCLGISNHGLIAFSVSRRGWSSPGRVHGWADRCALCPDTDDVSLQSECHSAQSQTSTAMNVYYIYIW